MCLFICHKCPFYLVQQSRIECDMAFKCHELSATFDENDSVLHGVCFRWNVGLWVVLMDEPFQYLRNEREVSLFWGRKKVVSVPASAGRLS